MGKDGDHDHDDPSIWIGFEADGMSGSKIKSRIPELRPASTSINNTNNGWRCSRGKQRCWRDALAISGLSWQVIKKCFQLVQVGLG